MGSLLVPIIIGGVAYELVEMRGQPSTPLASPPKPVQPNFGATTGQIMSGTASQNGSMPVSSYLDDSGQSSFSGSGGTSSDPDATSKLMLLQNAAQQSFNGMSQAAKTQAAQIMNQQLNLHPPLTGNETWEQVARIAGGAVGTGVCSIIPGVGVAIAPLCGMALAYLGVKLEDWLQGALPDLENWVSNNILSPVESVIGTVGDSAEDAYNAVAGAVGTVYDTFGNVVSNIGSTISNAADDVENWVSDLF
jgi:hypothetical protein